MIERIAKQMVARVPDRKRLQQPLQRPHERLPTPNVFEQDQRTTGTQHTPSLRQGTAIIRDRAERERADNGVESFGWEAKVLSVADTEVDVSTHCLRALSSDFQHPQTDVLPCEAHLWPVMWDISASPNGNPSTSPFACEAAQIRPSAKSKRSGIRIIES
jgi:hypothetical protein